MDDINNLALQMSALPVPASTIAPPIKHRRELQFEEAKAGFAAMIIEAAKAQNRELYIYGANKPKLNNILAAIVHDIDGAYNPSKGIYLYGRYSSGKTWMMDQLRVFLRQAYYTDWFSNVRLPYWVSYKKDIMMRARMEKDISFISTMFNNKDLIFVDDLGYEDDSQLVLWGNRENIIVELVDILYRRYLDGAIINITSNLQLLHPDPSTPCIYKRYGQGTHDRLVEMCTGVFWDSDKNLRTGKMY